MDRQKIIESLNLFKERLTGEVVEAFHSRGSEFGQERFNTWRRQRLEASFSDWPEVAR